MKLCLSFKVSLFIQTWQQRFCLFGLFRHKIKTVNENLSLLIQMYSPKITQCTLNTSLQNNSWTWTPGRQNALKFTLENGESKGRAPIVRYQRLILPELSLMACDKWDMSAAPTIIHNEIKVKWFVSLFSLSNHNEDRGPLRYWWSGYFLLLAYQAFSPQRITARIMHVVFLWMREALRCGCRAGDIMGGGGSQI